MPLNTWAVDLPFYLAVAAFGLGLSLATYRMSATHYGWPMGRWHAHRPALPILIGFACLVFAGLFALARGVGGLSSGGWAIPLLGIGLAIVWTGILRVGSQVSLLLAPAAAALLFFAWFGGPGTLDTATIRDALREEMKEIRQQLNLPSRNRDGTLNRDGTPGRDDVPRRDPQR